MVFVDVTARLVPRPARSTSAACSIERAVRDGWAAPGTVAMGADWTRPDPIIAAYLKSFGRYGIPFNAVYGPGAPEGIALSEILTPGDVLSALERARDPASAAGVAPSKASHRAGGDFPGATHYVVDAEHYPHRFRNSTHDRKRRGKAMIKVGDKIPSVKLKHMTAEGLKDITTDEIFKGKKVVLFALPGAFTPTCSAKHLPGFVQKAADAQGQGRRHHRLPRRSTTPS